MKYKRMLLIRKPLARFPRVLFFLLWIFLALCSGCGNDSVTDHTMPLADAGPDRALSLKPSEITRAVTLDGSLSRDPNGKITTYEWTGHPDPENIMSPTVNLPFGSHVFSLAVTNDKGFTSRKDQVVIQIHAPSLPKEAHAPELYLETTGYSVAEGSILEFPVSASDPDGEPVSLTAETRIPNARFSGGSGEHASGVFIFEPDYDQQGAYAVVFTATDPFGFRSSKTVTLRVDPVNRPPELTIPLNAVVEEGKILTVPVKALDPDQDILSYSVDKLPENAVFLPSTGFLTFVPGFDQAGTYPLNFTVSDGKETLTKTIVITVTKAPPGEDQANVSPETGGRKKRRPPASPVSPGYDATQSVPESPVVPRNVATLNGAVVSDSGKPVENATVRVQGTLLRTQTLQNGSFTLQNIPSGQHELLVNEPNHELTRKHFQSPAGAEIRLDKIEIKAKTFDRKAGPRAGLSSILDRGITDITGLFTLDEASLLIQDTLIFAGGTEAGVLDPYGNQINPGVEDGGKTSLSWKGVELYSQRLAMGESTTLMELFMELRFAFEWDPSPAPSFKEFLDGMQILVNRAWANPDNPSSRVPILLFNIGRTLNHNPPILTAATRLNLFQAYLAINSFMAAVYNHREDWIKKPGNGGSEITNPSGENPEEADNGAAHASKAKTPVASGIYTITWENLLKTFSSKPYAVATSAGSLKPSTLPGFESILKKYYLSPSESTRLNIANPLEISFPEVLISLDVEKGNAHSHFLNTPGLSGDSPRKMPAMAKRLHASLPLARPVILDAEDASMKMPENGKGLVLPVAKIVFLPLEEQETEGHSKDAVYVYRLWRMEIGRRKVTDPAGDETQRSDELKLVAWGALDGDNRLGPKREIDEDGNVTGRCFFKIPLQYSGMTSYRLDCLRFKGRKTMISTMDPSEFEEELVPWFSGYLENLTAWEPAGGLTAEQVHPARAILRNLAYDMSPLSEVISVFIRDKATGLTRYGKTWLAADYADSSSIYLSIPDYHSEDLGDGVTGAIFRYDGKTGLLGEYLRPGFPSPGPSGLTMDRKADLYAVDASTEKTLGAQIYRFPGRHSKLSSKFPDKTVEDGINSRQPVGSVNNIAEPMGLPNPASIAAMIMGKQFPDGSGEELFVADAPGFEAQGNGSEDMDSRIMRILMPSPGARKASGLGFGEPWAWNDWNEPNENRDDRDSLNFGPNSDMAFDRTGTTLFISQGGHVVQTRGGGNGSFSITEDGALFGNASGCAVCESNGEQVLFVADRAGGSVIGIPLDALTEPVPGHSEFSRMKVPVDEKEKEVFLNRYMVFSGLDRPDHIRITDNGKAMVVTDSTGIRYIPFGFSGRLLADGLEPVVGAVITIKTMAGEKSTITDREGWFRFLDVDGYSVIAEVSHPDHRFTRRITLTGKCNTFSDEPKPCVVITEPADGSVTASERITVRGIIHPNEGAFSKSGGNLVVVSPKGTSTYKLRWNGKKNQFRAPNVQLHPGINHLRVYTHESGTYGAGGSLFSSVTRSTETGKTQAVSGLAKNPKGDPLPGAAVEIHVDGKLEALTEADACGYYNAKNLPLGKISVKF
jgi:hypothetical protein